MTAKLKPAATYVRIGCGRVFPSKRPWCVFGVRPDGTKDTLRCYSSEAAALAFIEGMSYSETNEIPKYPQRGM